MLNFINKTKTFPWKEILIPIFAGILGVFSEPMVQAIEGQWFLEENLPYVSYVLITLAFIITSIVSLSMWNSTKTSVSNSSALTERLISSLENVIRTVPFEEGYEEVGEKVKSAKNEIIIFTQYAFDWENQQATWDPNRKGSKTREEFYNTIQSKLRIEKDKSGFRLVKIIGLPESAKLEDILATDPIYRENCEFILNLAKNKPEFASIRTSNLEFSNSVILVDNTFAHISFELNDPKKREVGAPFVMIVDDPDSLAIKNLNTLIKRIEAYSNIVTELNISS